jgi:hypothetical protein
MDTLSIPDPFFTLTGRVSPTNDRTSVGIPGALFFQGQMRPGEFRHRALALVPREHGGLEKRPVEA